MGYFSRLNGTAQCEEALTTPTAQAAANQPDSKPAAAVPVSAVAAAPQPQVPAAPAAAQVPMETGTLSAVVAEDPAACAAGTPEPPAIQLDTSTSADDTAARQAHEAAEAKRKSDWDAKQREKASAEQARLSRLAAMSDEDAIAASTQRVGTDTERLTRRNMKDCVAAHVQELCRQDPAFARKTLHPRKSMIHCFQYIYRKAKGYIQAEMKANGIQDEMKANGVQPESGVYGEDVPDELVYQWAADYFNDPNAQEDREKDDKFIPKPYVGKSSKTSKAAPKKEPAAKATPKPKPQLNASVDGQMSFLGVAG